MSHVSPRGKTLSLRTRTVFVPQPSGFSHHSPYRPFLRQLLSHKHKLQSKKTHTHPSS